MTRTTTRTGIAAAFLVLAGVLAGCSAAQPGPGPSTGTAEASTDHAVASCMRDAGHDVTDDDYARIPTTGGEDRRAALTKCLQEHDPQQAREAEESENSAANRETWAKLAECMRKAGYEDYPDDPNDESFTPPKGDAAFTAALDTCTADAGLGVRTQ